MPGRFTPPIPDRLAPQCAINALTSVPDRFPAAGCTTKPLRLVDHDQRIVLVDNIEGDILRLRLCRRIWRHDERDGVARIDAVPRIADCGFVDCRSASQDQGLQARTREGGEALRQHTVKPLALLGGANLDGVNVVGHEYKRKTFFFGSDARRKQAG